jgi:hypothetical protein
MLLLGMNHHVESEWVILKILENFDFSEFYKAFFIPFAIFVQNVLFNFLPKTSLA